MPAPANPNAAIADAVSALSRSPAFNNLSPSAKYLGQAVEVATSEGLGRDVESFVMSAASQVASNIASNLQSLGEIGDAIPIIGTALGEVFQAISAFEAFDAHEAEFVERMCENLAHVPVIASGADGKTMPADIFWIDAPNGMSSIGRALIQVTESNNAADSSDDTWNMNAINPPARSQGGLHQLQAAYKALVPSEPNVGIPKERRTIFQKLRIAIGSLRNVADGDGGVSLWPLYLDLLRQEYDAGHITGGYLAYLLGHYVSYNTGEILDYCPAASTALVDGAIAPLLAAWIAHVRPVYAQDKAKLAAELKQAGTVDLKAAVDKAIYRAKHGGADPPAPSSAVDALKLAAQHPFDFSSPITPAAHVAIARRALAQQAAAEKRAATEAIVKTAVSHGIHLPTTAGVGADPSRVTLLRTILSNPNTPASARAFWQRRLGAS